MSYESRRYAESLIPLSRRRGTTANHRRSDKPIPTHAFSRSQLERLAVRHGTRTAPGRTWKVTVRR